MRPAQIITDSSFLFSLSVGDDIIFDSDMFYQFFLLSLPTTEELFL
jgi:hypothetical protein